MISGIFLGAPPTSRATLNTRHRMLGTRSQEWILEMEGGSRAAPSHSLLSVLSLSMLSHLSGRSVESSRHMGDSV